MYNKVKAGNTIKAYGLEFEVLDPTFEAQDGTGILCLAKEPIKEMAFSEENGNDYTISDVREFLKEHTRKLEEKGAEFCNVKLDLIADDGTGYDKEPIIEKGAFLLSADMYRKYRRYISNKDKWWWLSTAYSFSEDYSSDARIVHTDGSLNNNSAYNGDYGVVPAYVFSSLLLDEDTDEKEKGRIEEISAKLEQFIKDAEEIKKQIENFGRR